MFWKVRARYLEYRLALSEWDVQGYGGTGNLTLLSVLSLVVVDWRKGLPGRRPAEQCQGEAKKPSPGTDGHEDVFLHCLHTFVATVKDGHKSFGDFCLEWEAVTILVNFGAGHSHGIGEEAVVLFDAAAAAAAERRV